MYSPSELATRRHRRRLRRRWVPVAAAALLLSFLAGGFLADIGGPVERIVAAAEMRAATGEVVGRVAVHDGDPDALHVTLPGWAEQMERYGPSDTSYQLRIESRDGQIATGPVDLSGDASWTTSLDIDADAITTVSVVDGNGHVWCSAYVGTDATR